MTARAAAAHRDESRLAPVLVGCGPAPAGSLPGPQQIGFKAHNLLRMAAIGLPVPCAFVLGTAWCTRAADLASAHYAQALDALHEASGLAFGDARAPLLVSVRSGAPVSMPGMMDTLLNVGLADATLPGFVRSTGNPRLAWDAYRRLVAGWGEVVGGIAPAAFEQDVAAVARTAPERELDYAQLRAIVQRHLETVRRESGEAFPQDPQVQLLRAIRAVFASWQGDKAVAYRRLKSLPDDMGTAVTVQKMVFGNAGPGSGAGVGFTRHPSTGEREPWIDFLFNAQGEDVVSGRRTACGHEQLAAVAPQAWAELLDAVGQLERAFGDMQDFEFTVESSRLYLLQTRNGKRTPLAAARIALDLFDEGLIDRPAVLKRTAELDEDALAQSRVVARDGALPQPLAGATAACTGVACGPIALDEAAAQRLRARGTPPILVRTNAETADIAALELSGGLLTVHGARTSHAAVVARQLGKVCLVGCASLAIDGPARTVRIGPAQLREGDLLALDGNTGQVYAGDVATQRWLPQDVLARLAALHKRPARR